MHQVIALGGMILMYPIDHDDEEEEDDDEDDGHDIRLN